MMNPILHAIADEVCGDSGSMLCCEMILDPFHCLLALVASVFARTLKDMIGILPKLVAFETSAVVFIIKCL